MTPDARRRRGHGLPWDGKAVFLVAALWVVPLSVAAQAATPLGGAGSPPAETSTVDASIAIFPPISPRGALLRALVVPGWGHAAIGSHTRAGFYFGLETLTAYTFLRTRIRLGDARARAAFRERFLTEGLVASGMTDPSEVEAAMEDDAVLSGYRDLVASRERQQEDLVAFGIFVLLLSGADAYVSTHLARFPAPIEVDVAATDDGRTEVALRLTLPR